MAKISFVFLFFALLISDYSYCQAYSLSPYDSTTAIFSENQKKGVRNSAGKILLAAKYDDLGWSGNASTTNTEFLGYKNSGLWGLLNAELKPVTQAKYVELNPLNKEIFIAAIKGKYSQTKFYGLIDQSGDPILDFSYRNLLPAGDQLIAASSQANSIQFGLVDPKGKELLPFNYFQIRYLGNDKFELTENSGEKSLVYIDRRPEVIYQDFDSVSDFRDGVAILFKEGKQGVISNSGKILLPVQYKKIEWNSGKKIYVTTLNQWQILKKDSKTIFKTEADTVFFLNDSVVVQSTGAYSEVYDIQTEKSIASLPGKLLGFFGPFYLLKRDEETALVSPDSLMKSLRFSEKVFWDANYFIGAERGYSGLSYQLVNKSGEKMVADTFKFLPESIAVRKEGFWSVYNQDFKEVIPPLYHDITPTAAEQYIVKFRDSYGVVDKNNQWVISPKYLRINEIEAGVYHAVNKYLHEFIISGRGTSEAKMYYDTYGPYLIERDNEDNFRMLDSEGMPLTSFNKGQYIGHNSEWILFRNKDEISFYNNNGKNTFQINGYDTVFLSTDKFMPIMKNGSFGFIDQAGLLTIANRYDSVQGFSEGMAGVKIRNNWGYINRREELKLQPYFTEVSAFRNGLAVVKYNNKYGIIDKEGEFALDAVYDRIIKKDGFFLFKENGKWGFADKNASVISYPNYESVEMTDKYFIVKKYSSYKVLDHKGNNLFEMQFDKIVYDSDREVFLSKKEGKTQQVFLTDLLKGKKP